MSELELQLEQQLEQACNTFQVKLLKAKEKWREAAATARNLGVLQALRSPQDALDSFRRSLTYNVHDHVTWRAYSASLFRLGQDEMALRAYGMSVVLERICCNEDVS